MPRQIDSIGRKPEENNIKPVAEHKAGQLYRPRNAGHQAGDVIRPADYNPASEKPAAKANVSAHAVAEHKAQKKAKRSTPAGKRRRTVMALAVTAGILVIGGLFAVLVSQKLRDAITKPKPPAGVFAQIGDAEISQDDYDKLKTAYRKFNSTTGNKQSSDSDRQAADDLITLAALQQAAGSKVECSATEVDNRFANQYATQGGKEKYLAFVKDKYGWDESTIRARACLAFYEDYAKQNLISHYGLAGIYIRWDTQTNLSQAQQDAYGTAATARLQKDYLPLFASGKSKEEIFRAADVNPFQDETLVNDRIADFTQPYSRTLDLGYITRDQGFNAYADGEDNWQYIDKLKIGENTPVFKSNSGYYVIYRLTDKVIGQYSSISELRNSYMNEGKLNPEYYLLPDRAPKVNGGVPAQSSNTDAAQQLGLMDRAKSVIIPAAQAAGNIGCWSAHLLGFNITYLDINTGMPISVATPPGAGKGVTNDAAVQALSTHTSLPTSCSSVPTGNLGNGSSASIFLNHYLVQSDPMASNPMGFFLTCYDSWDWSFTAPTGYQPLSATDYQAGNRFLVYSSAFGLRWAPSSQPGFYRLPSSLYAGIANGPNVNYDIAVYFTPNAVTSPTPTPLPRLMNANSTKRNSADQSTSGAFSGQTVTIDGTASSTANPYTYNNLTANENHQFTIDPTVPGGAFDFEKWRACFNGRCTEGPSTSYIYAANTAQVGENLELTWYFKLKPSPSTLHLGALVDDGSGVKNPCALSAGSARAFCGQSSITVSGQPAVTTNATDNTADVLVGGGATYTATLNNPPSNWKVIGYISCANGAAANCFNSTVTTTSTGNDISITIPPGTQRYVYFVIAPDLNIPAPTVSCGTISGSVSGVVTNVQTQLKLDGTVITPGTGSTVSGNSYSFIIPDEYKDGQSRAITLAVSYDSFTAAGRTSIDKVTGLNHACPNDAQCSASFTTEVQNVFGAAGVGDAGLTGINIRVEMKNTGQSTWRSQWAGSSNKHHLALTQAALDQGWKIQPQNSADITPAATAAVAPGSTNSFQIVLESPATPLTGSTLQFQMSYLIGTNENYFGAVCSAPITVRGYYHPWLQVQNGAVGAIKAIRTQPAASRGFRDSAGTGQNLNLDAQYAILSWVEVDPFCSSNAYLYGQADGPIGGCVGEGYKFTMPASLATNFEAQDKDSDAVYNGLSTLASQASCGPGGPLSADATQANKLADLTIGAPGTFGLAGDPCAVIYRYQPGAGGPKTLGAASATPSAPNSRYVGGRATIMVDGDLTINNNIIYDMQGAQNLGINDDVAQLRAINGIPNLAIVVRGNVKIARNVERIDAMIYSSGVLSTCDAYASGATIGGTKTSVDAKACAVKPLVIRGGLVAKQSLQFGRNWYDVARIAGVYGLPGGANAFSNAGFDTQAVTAADPQGGYSGNPAESVIANGLTLIAPPPGLQDFGGPFAQARYLQGEITPVF